MFHRIQQYPLMTAEGRVFRPRAYGDPQPDGMWDGWLVFFPIDRGAAIASDRETTQPSLPALTAWASNLTEVYLGGALDRALRLAEQPPILSDLARAEYEALDAAERLETAAELERQAANTDDVAAASARADAQEIRRERVVAEDALLAAEEKAANAEAVTHEQAARKARSTAADARRRRQRATPKPKRSK
jgi:hypothetical protein